jgi:hypothetical protein
MNIRPCGPTDLRPPIFDPRYRSASAIAIAPSHPAP